MAGFLLFPLRLLGFAATGLVLGAGWKLGSHLVDVAMGEKELKWPDLEKICPREEGEKEPEPLWKRKFPRFSEE